MKARTRAVLARAVIYFYGVAKPKVEMQREELPSWKSFLLEMMIYGAILFAYFWLVLHYLSTWFKELFDENRQLFAIMALVVMIGQTVCLEVVSALLVWRVGRRKA